MDRIIKRFIHITKTERNLKEKSHIKLPQNFRFNDRVETLLSIIVQHTALEFSSSLCCVSMLLISQPCLGYFYPESVCSISSVTTEWEGIKSRDPKCMCDPLNHQSALHSTTTGWQSKHDPGSHQHPSYLVCLLCVLSNKLSLNFILLLYIIIIII